MLDNLPPHGLTMHEFRDLVGQDGLLLVTAFLSLVFLVPVSIPGVSTVLGAAILAIGLCRILQRDLWLPQRLARRVLPSDRLHTVLNLGSRWLHRLERMARPQRLHWMVASRPMVFTNNSALMLGALLLMLPLGFIPFSNTLPALALLFMAIGLLQRDGLCVLFGHLLNVATVLKFSLIFFGGLELARAWLQGAGLPWQ